MEKEELRGHIENIIQETFKRLKYAYSYNQESKKRTNPHEEKYQSRLVFPSYSNSQTRISEQELRFSFIEAFNEYCDKKELPLFYSIETPTLNSYSGFSKTRIIPTPEPQQDDNGRSGEFDMVIFDLDENCKKLRRKCLIEFKAKNASELDHKKDFVKLSDSKEGGDGVLRYFIEILESYDEETVDSLREKIASKNDITSFVCYSLKTSENISDKFNKIS